MTTTQKNANRPMHNLRYGLIKAAIWRNAVDNGNASRQFYSVTFGRAFKDGDTWRNSQNFGYEDLLVLAKIANDCHTWIAQQLARDGAQARAGDPTSSNPRGEMSVPAEK